MISPPPPPPLTIPNPITAPSSYPPGMISGLPYPLTNSDSLKKSQFFGSCSNHPSHWEEVVLAHLRISHTRLTHSFLYLGLSPLPFMPILQWRRSISSTLSLLSCSWKHRLRHSVSPSLMMSLSNNHDKIINSMNYLRPTNFPVSSKP